MERRPALWRSAPPARGGSRSERATAHLRTRYVVNAEHRLSAPGARDPRSGRGPLADELRTARNSATPRESDPCPSPLAQPDAVLRDRIRTEVRRTHRTERLKQGVRMQTFYDLQVL